MREEEKERKATTQLVREPRTQRVKDTPEALSLSAEFFLLPLLTGASPICLQLH